MALFRAKSFEIFGEMSEFALSLTYTSAKRSAGNSLVILEQHIDLAPHLFKTGIRAIVLVLKDRASVYFQYGRLSVAYSFKSGSA